MGKYYNVDPETCTKEELLEAIDGCALKEEYFHTMEQSCKVFINSQYGALANKFYNCSNVDIAESITLQGQDLIKYSVVVVNEYFSEKWPSQTDTHHLIANYMKEKFSNFKVDDFLESCKRKIYFGDTLQIYGDTDSAYITLNPIIKSCGIPLEMETEFVIAINKFVLDPHLDLMFGKYADSYNCKENLQKFELEKIARSVIMIAKKKYIMDISWKEPDVHIAPLHSLVYKGIEVVQGSTPKFCREMMKEFIEFTLASVNMGEKPTFDAVVKKLREIKNKFAMQSPNEISKSFGMSDYEKYVLDDKKTLTYTDAVTPIHVRAAATYNHALYTTAKKWKSKYDLIKKGDKVKFYYTSNDNVFAFLPDNYPLEFAPKMDLDVQFEKMILEPLNKIVLATGYSKVSATLTYSAGLW